MRAQLIFVGGVKPSFDGHRVVIPQLKIDLTDPQLNDAQSAAREDLIEALNVHPQAPWPIDAAQQEVVRAIGKQAIFHNFLVTRSDDGVFS